MDSQTSFMHAHSSSYVNLSDVIEITLSAWPYIYDARTFTQMFLNLQDPFVV